jgi:hypothetical protein
MFMSQKLTVEWLSVEHGKVRKRLPTQNSGTGHEYWQR